MTALEKILEVIGAEEIPVKVGYGGDLGDFLASKVGPRLMAYVSIGFDSPDGYTSDGKVTRWRGSFSVWIRSQYAAGQESETYTKYITLRSALDGAEYEGGKLKLVGGAPQIADGLAEPQLMIEART